LPSRKKNNQGFKKSHAKTSSLFFYFARKINILAEAGRSLPGLELLLLFYQEKSKGKKRKGKLDFSVASQVRLASADM
jgi:hypothetical protein